MRIKFASVEAALEIARGEVGVLDVANRKLFSRFALAALESFGPETLEPARLQGDGAKLVSASKALFIVGDPLHLDFGRRELVSLLFKRIGREALDCEAVDDLERLNLVLQSAIRNLSLSMHGEYSFHADWDIAKYLKAQGFSFDLSAASTLYDKLQAFIGIAADLLVGKCIVFVSLQRYLAIDEYRCFVEECRARQLQVLLIESGAYRPFCPWERVVVIDENYIEEVF